MPNELFRMQHKRIELCYVHDIHSSFLIFHFLFLFVVLDFCIKGVVNLDPVCLIEDCSTFVTIIVREFHNSMNFPTVLSITL